MKQIKNEIQGLSRERFITNEGSSAYAPHFAMGDLKYALLGISGILASKNVSNDITANRLTLGMIKPRLDEGVRQVGKEQLLDSYSGSQEPKVEDILLFNAVMENEIQPYVNPIAVFSLLIDARFLSNFYNGRSQKRQRVEKPIDPHRYGRSYETRWEEYTDLMTLWPITFLLISSQNNTASTDWRTVIGKKWKRSDLDLPEHADKLRGRLVKDEHNSLFHGSDSPNDAQREVELLNSYVVALSSFYYSLLY